MLEAIGITKKYGDHLALDDVSFTLEPGCVYALLGPNGAGKSTTMNIITGYIGATSGEVFIEGKDLSREPEEAKKHIGYLPEIPPLYADMTVREYLTFMARLKHVPAAEQKKAVDEVTELTRIGEMSRRLIGNLSKGYKQRVGLAYAILGFPEIIILDEPTVGIDPKQLEDVRDLIRSLAGEHTVVFSSHILPEAQSLCDHAIILNNGRITASGTIRELEEKAGAKDRVILRAEGTAENVRSVLESCAFIRSFEVSEGDGAGATARIAMPEKDEALAGLFRAFAQADLPVLELRPEEVTMEDLFMRFTGDENEEAER